MTPDDFLVKDYELKTAFLTNQYQRMWTRFNYFVTLESALAGGKLLVGGSPTWFPVIGAGLSLIWYVIGAEDRYLVRVYRAHVNEAAKCVAAKMGTGDYVAVGARDSETVKKLKEEDLVLSWPRRFLEHLSGWRCEPISITRLAAIIPLVLLLAWISVFVTGHLLG
jgi:hypothetical protein